MDGQPMCTHRVITAGTENSNVTKAEASKAGATATSNRSGPLPAHIVVFKYLMVSESLWLFRNADKC